MKTLRRTVVVAGAALLFTSAAPAQELFRGKTVRIIAGSVAGGYYDN